MKLRLSIAATMAILFVLSGLPRWAALANAQQGPTHNGASPADSAQDPMGEIQASFGKAVTILDNHALDLRQRRQQLRDLAQQHFDFAYMARSTLGYHWRTMPAAERQEFVPLFSSFMEVAYLTKIQGYLQFKVHYLRALTVAPGDSEVDVNVFQANSTSPIPVAFYLRKEAQGWKVYDVAIDGIRMVSNYRTQFNRVINDHGFDQLMVDLRRKDHELTQLLAEPTA